MLRSPLVVAEVTQFVTGAPWSARTGLDWLGLDRELYNRDLRRAAHLRLAS